MTEHPYDVVQRFRNLGGNLMFLAANNFFWKVRRHGQLMTKVQLWRQLGRPEAALVGVQYVASDCGARQGGYVVRAAARAPWVFAGTGLSDGDTFGRLRDRDRRPHRRLAARHAGSSLRSRT